MRSLTFILDTQTGTDAMAPATITITEQADGSLLFTISNIDDGDALIADIRGLFFDVADDTLLGTLSYLGDDVTEFVQNGSVSNLGGGVSTNGIPDSPYEIGIEFGTPGISTDDLQTTSFILSSSLRALTLDDIALESIAVRQTSVTSADGGREDSDKLYGIAPYPVNAVDDTETLTEDTVATGNLFANDIDEDAGDADGDNIPDGLTVTAINGNPALVGTPMMVADGVIITVYSDGSYEIDAQDTDWLAVGESLSGSLTYSVDDGNGGTDTASFEYTVDGLNDAPIAEDDSGTTDENSITGGDVLNNDHDPDLSDTLIVSAVNGDPAGVGQTITLNSGALLTLNSDGSYTYDPNGAFDSLNSGEEAHDSFTYEISDGNGGFDTANVLITITGIGDGGGDDPANHFGTFTNKRGTADHEISNIVLYLQDDEGGILKVKIDGWNDVTDLDNIDLDAFLINEDFFDYELLAVSIKAGNNHNRDLGPGEGQLFLLDGDDNIDYEEGGATPDGLTLDDLGAKADITYDYDISLFI